MASASGEVVVGPMEICTQVNKFLKGTSSSGGNVNLESLSSSALFLLRTVPVARHAVLEHYSLLFDDAINSSLSFSDRVPRDVRGHQKLQLSALQDVTGVLLSFIKSSPEAWAPVVSSWTLTLLGQLSSKYASKRGIQHATSLNEVLQMWLACEPAKMLMEISTECFAAMVGAAPDMCVDTLLETSVRYSPHFDWVVAHIGSCFPRTIITRVLNCGLKDYCNDGGPDKDSGPSTSRLKVPKMASVVGILGHLASKHGHDIRKALMALFEASLHSDAMSSKVTTLPFLLQLASMSDMLLQILTTDLVCVLTPATLNQLHRQFTHWKRASPGDYNSFLNLVVHLIVKSKIGACDIICFVLNTAVPTEDTKGELPTEEVRETCAEIMHILMFELQRGVLSTKSDLRAVEIPLLVGLASQTHVLTNMLIAADGRRLSWLQKLLTYTALHAGQSCAASILASIICSAETLKQLSNFYKVKQAIEVGIPSVLQPAVQQVFNRLEALAASPPVDGQEGQPPATKVPRLHAQASPTTGDGVSSLPNKPSSHLSQLVALRNLERITAAEKRKIKKKQISSSRLVKELQKHQASMVRFLLFPEASVQRCALSLVHMVGFPASLGPALLTELAGAVACVYFSSVQRKAEQPSPRPDKPAAPGGKNKRKCAEKKEPERDKGNSASCITRLCMCCIDQLSSLPFTRSLLLHYLVEGATSKDHCHLFGGKWTMSLFEPPSSSLSSAGAQVMVDPAATEGSLITDSNSLLNENRQQGNSIALPRFHSSVYHGGVIRQIVKVASSSKSLPKSQVSANVLALVETLWLCCREFPQATQAQLPQWGAPASGLEAGAAPEVKAPVMDTDMRPKQATVSESSARTLGCVIVDILTLDSLYNDVNWQDPDFRKVTTERDILVWKRLADMPFLWSILQEFSSSCVFLYYVSPVLRSLVAVVMNHLEVSREAKMKSCAQHYEAAVRLVYCLTQGRWIPPPLSNVSELFPYVTPYEGYLLLLALWRYIKDKPPSEFEAEIKERTCDSSHMLIVNSIIHANIGHMGHLCARMFNM
ncbi:hypothetical protein EGW08_000541 [Elysia chlorotica]|uniref:Integrator complex subunit 5 C-terminal domain-containing protein n=1 Tax=Elysia chlorotica TaxID=188477 RepID=A0A433UCZ6_ELYCH|nr:hypothetical protein EGW08_000541 [Elysia chlorotica]